MIFFVDYTFHGVLRKFTIRLDHMDDQIALYWACCDAGIEKIPNSYRVKHRPVCSQKAHIRGLANVKWS